MTGTSTIIKYFGRQNDFKGKTLWEVVGNLKNFGVGRIIVRSIFERYPEPCFMKIIKVEAQPNEGCRKVKVVVEKTFRGNTYLKTVQILSTSYKADYRLIPIHEEVDYCRVVKRLPEKILPADIDFPPLFLDFIKEETKEVNPMLKVKFRPTRDKLARLVKEGETPNIHIGMKLGEVASPDLYENIN